MLTASILPTMSGLEIAGTILGAIPVIVVALQLSKRQVDETKQKWRLFRNRAQYIDRLIDSLECQKMMIAGDLAVLIRAAAAPLLDDYSLLNVTGINQLLERQDVRHRLETYLGERYDSIRKTLMHCETSSKDIAAKISECTSGGSSVSKDSRHSIAKLISS